MNQSQFSVETLNLPGVDIGPESTLPPVHRLQNIQQAPAAKLPEDAELYLGYGFVPGAFPYPFQDNYTRQLGEKNFVSIVLENEFLRAVFLPELGGRLWSLFDKKAGRELLFKNPVFRLGNLALRNAWFAGGVEFNCGPIGHHPHTCDVMHSARLALPDGTPVLRMYTFERIRAMVYQMDFFLPAGQPYLYGRMRIVNETAQMVPAYWWSNIACPAYPGGRVLVDADSAYSNTASTVQEIPAPMWRGVDISYPESSPGSIDYFWNLPAAARKAVAHVDADGYGLVQFSTARQKGRKLFVWGQTPGGQNWQDYLSDEAGGGNYVEIQAGLGKTQYECVPMPPHSAWEWVEAYGAVQGDAKTVHGDWAGAKRHFNELLNMAMPAEKLEDLLRGSADMAKTPADEMIVPGTGWGALENERRTMQGEDALSKHLDFGCIGPVQSYWHRLLETGEVPADGEICSWMLQPEWLALLEKSAAQKGAGQWAAALHLGLAALAQSTSHKSLKSGKAETWFEKSMELCENAYALFGLSVCAEIEQDTQKSAEYALRAASLRVHDVCFAREAAKRLLRAERYDDVLELIDGLHEQSYDGRILLCKAMALQNLGRLNEAEGILMRNGGLEVPDVRERENTVTNLWFALHKARSEPECKTPTPPQKLDFRLDPA